jgi:hypothetical protein
VKVRKGDMVWVLARMPIDFYQYEMTRARKDQKKSEGRQRKFPHGFLRSRKK